jgi:hypothetical protein
MNNEWICPVRPEDIPQQYNWVAQSRWGLWCAYEDEPRPFEDILDWCQPSKSVFLDFYLGETEPNANWRNTKQQIPR